MNTRRCLRLFAALGGACIAMLLASSPASAQALLTHVAGRQAVSLNGDWHAIVDPYETGYYNYRREAYDQQPKPGSGAFFADPTAREAGALIEFDFDASPTLAVPGDWNTQRESLHYYEGTVWYQRRFDAAPAAPGARRFVYFGAANYIAEVYLNGIKLGRHEGGFTPFNFEVTALLRARDNALVVKVDNTRRADGVPTTSTDWWNYGGITRDVLLIDEPPTFIRDYVVQLRRGEPSNVIAGFVQLDGANAAQAVSIELPELGVRHVLTTDASGRGSFEFAAPGLQRWSPDAPQRYVVRVASADQVLTDQIGFRTIETRGSELLLNGEPVFLRGISLHEENPLRGGRATGEADARVLLGWAKALGCNYVRLAHYPHNEAMVRTAEAMGLLVWEEIPVYWTIDFSNPATLANARDQLTAMITRDRNRAAVIVWSMANETPPGEVRNTFLRALIAQARTLDDSRLISAALETHGEDGTTVVSDSIGNDLDIVAFNQYRGWYGGTLDDAPAARWDIRFDKPVVVSEFGGGAKQGLHGSKETRWTEEYQAWLYAQNLAMLDRMPRLRGMSPWILADFRSPRRLLPGVQDGFNRKGLISETGVPKLAHGVLQRYYAARAASAGKAPADAGGAAGKR